MIHRVKSGDPENVEAQAARKYWKLLFGKDFKRDSGSRFICNKNALLNYGYTIIRAAMARAVCGTGLTPAFGIHHRNLENPFCLVDDLMEPFRPIVDLQVADLLNKDKDCILNPETKKELAGILEVNLVNHQGQNSSLAIIMQHVALSFCDSLQLGKPVLRYPKSVSHGGHLL